MQEDAELLQTYADTGSEQAFAEIVRRHLNLTYSVAMRQLGGDPHLAQDVSQKVFASLARKASALAGRKVISGWLYQAAQFSAIDTLRAEQRRKVREQEALVMHELAADHTTETDWDKLRPFIDHTIAELDERDRDAVTLRFFENCSFAAIGARLQLSEDAARMRVDRALEKVRGKLVRRGVTSTTAALALALSSQVGFAAPAGFAATVTTTATAAAASVAGATSFTASLFKFMTTYKLATSTAALFTLIAAGTAVGNARKESPPLAPVELQNPATAVLAPQDEPVSLANISPAIQTGGVSAVQGKTAKAPVLVARAEPQLAAAVPRAPKVVPPDIIVAGAGDLPREDGAALILNLAPFYRTNFASFTGEKARFATILGRQVIDGVPLLIEGDVSLFGQTKAERSTGAARYDPHSIQGIRVGRRFDELHLVHSTTWWDFVGRQIATLTLHYEDGTHADLPIIYGVNVSPDMRLPTEEVETVSDPATKIIWRGPGPGSVELHASCRLFKTVFNNPQPAKRVETLDVSSAGEPLAAYRLIAATVTPRDANRPITPALPYEPDRNFDGRLTVQVREAGTQRPVANALLSVGIEVEGVYLIGSPLMTSEKGEAIVRFPSSTTTGISVGAKKDDAYSSGGKWKPGDQGLILELR